MSSSPTTQRSLGLWRATSLVTGNVVGSGILMLPASLGLYGTLGFIGWIITSLGAICLALIFSRLSKRFPKSGGPYTYCHEAFGDFIGFQMAWSYWVGTWASNAAIATAFVSYLTVFWPELATNMGLSFTVAFFTVWVFTGINIIGVRTAGIVQVIATVLKILPLIAIGIFGLSHIQFEHFVPVNPSGQPVFGAITTATALTLYAFLGIESATVPSENVINPEKTIPRATILGTVIAAIIYIWTMIVILGIIPPLELSQSTAPFAEAGRVVFGDWSVPLIGASAAAAIFVSLNGWILLQGQIPLAAAKDGLFPGLFAKTSRNGTPVASLVISASLMTIMLLMNYQATLIDQFTTIVTFTTFTVLLPYLYSAAADLLLLLTDSAALSRGQLIRSVTISVLGFGYTILTVIGSGQGAVYLGMLFVFCGFPIYIWMKRTAQPQKISNTE